MYTGPVKAALQNAWPREKKHLMLEDNDPTGFKSGLGETAKKAASIKAFVIPKRSPDLSVLDYAIWKFMTRRMHAQEHKFSPSKRETRAAYIERLRRAAMSNSKKSIGKAIANFNNLGVSCFIVLEVVTLRRVAIDGQHHLEPQIHYQQCQSCPTTRIRVLFRSCHNLAVNLHLQNCCCLPFL